MGKHYHANYRLGADYHDNEELPVPLWVWPLAAVVILLVLVVH